MADLYTPRTLAIAAVWIVLSLLGAPTSSIGGLLGRVVAALLVVGAVKFAYTAVRNRGESAAA